jgi:hypothetical protein
MMCPHLASEKKTRDTTFIFDEIDDWSGDDVDDNYTYQSERVSDSDGKTVIATIIHQPMGEYGTYNSTNDSDTGSTSSWEKIEEQDDHIEL